MSTDTDIEPTYATPWEAVHAARQALDAAVKLLQDDACADQANLADIVFQLRRVASHCQALTPSLLVRLGHQVRQGQIVSATSAQPMTPNHFSVTIRADLITLTNCFGQAANVAAAGHELLLYKHATDLPPAEMKDPRE